MHHDVCCCWLFRRKGKCENMRVITGSSRGRRLVTPNGDAVRPTTDNVKESEFSIMQCELEGRQFLDAVAGSGQRGMEALSRGAAGAVFLDNSKASLAIVRQNLALTKLQERAKVIQTDTLSYLASCRERFDIAYLDPPYQQGLLQKALVLLPQVMQKSGVILCEHPADEVLPETVENFAAKKHYKYGKIMITVYSDKDVDGI